jgi:hypothetical protein
MWLRPEVTSSVFIVLSTKGIAMLMTSKLSVPIQRNLVAKHARINKAARHVSKAKKVGRMAKHKVNTAQFD